MVYAKETVFCIFTYNQNFMDIALKYKLVERLIQTDDDVILNEIKVLLGISEPDFWNELPLFVKESIVNAKKEMDNSNGFSNNQIFEEVRKRYL